MPFPRDLPGRPDERVLRQLVAALLYEGLLEPTVNRSRAYSEFIWLMGEDRYRCRATIGAFGRVRPLSRSVEIMDRSGRWREAELAPLVEALAGSGENRKRLLTELRRTVDLCLWNEAHVPRIPLRGMTFDQIESAMGEGHPYHPCFKARIGFSEQDHCAYGPEAGNSFQLIWLAVARGLLDQSLPDDEASFWRRELGEETFTDLRRRCDGLSGDFGLIPVHPWQWTKIKDGALASLVTQGLVHDLGPAGDHYRASQSVRTLFNVDRPYMASIKLAMNMINTSTQRTLDPQSVMMAPVVSRWLETVIAGDPLFVQRYPLAILPEYAGLVADRKGPLSGQLAAIWRGNIDAVLEEGEQAVPFNALMALGHNGKPFIDGWIREYGLSNWLDHLLDIVVLPVWHFLVAHGIATECHGQNMILVHRNGWPVRLVLRDFHDSLEYVHDFLREPEKVPDFLALDPSFRDAAPNENYWMDSTQALGELTVDCLFIYNLSEVSHLLQECYGLPEDHFWLRIRNRLNRYAAEHELEERQARVLSAGGEIATESLLSRKLHPDRVEHSHLVPNMLSDISLTAAKTP